MRSGLDAMTVRLASAVARALARRAAEAGQEIADYAADVLARDAMSELTLDNPSEAHRLQAELAIKAAAIAFARAETSRVGFDPHITLKVFRHIRSNEALAASYRRAIGDRPGSERGNPVKARINRTLGAAIKTALGAVPQTVEGNPLKVQVSGEFITSFTPLAPGSD